MNDAVTYTSNVKNKLYYFYNVYVMYNTYHILYYTFYNNVSRKYVYFLLYI